MPLSRRRRQYVLDLILSSIVFILLQKSTHFHSFTPTTFVIGASQWEPKKSIISISFHLSNAKKLDGKQFTEKYLPESPLIEILRQHKA